MAAISRSADNLADAIRDIETHIEAFVLGLDSTRKELVCDEVTVNATEHWTDGADGRYSYGAAEVELTLKVKLTPQRQRQVGEMLERLGFYLRRHLDLEV